jgi:predicted NAD-dependent protein-ADP-ribosyltransferase YbiA (DUF1768 family)
MRYEDQYVLVVFGKLKYTYAPRDVLFFPIYLVVKNSDKLKIKSKIGIAEIPSTFALHILADEDNDLDVTSFDSPLLFSFVTPAYMRKFRTEACQIPSAPIKVKPNILDEDGKANDGSQKSPSIERVNTILAHGIFKKNTNIQTPIELPEETLTDVESIHSSYDENKATHWVQRAFRNDHFEIHEVDKNANCLFNVVCAAFQQLGEETTVAKLRALVAKNASESVFEAHRELYESVTKSITDFEDQLRSIKSKLIEFPKDEILSLTKKSLQHEIASLQQLHAPDFKNLETLEHFREYIMTTRFWADAWAIDCLEHALNLRIILLSEDHFQEGDDHHLWIARQCEIKKPFVDPKYYILSSFKTGNVFQLVGYKNDADAGAIKKIFTFAEIPLDIKNLIVASCAEQKRASFNAITPFRDMISQLGYSHEAEEGDNEDEDKDNLVFQFYEKSAARAFPGHGPTEAIPSLMLPKFTGLHRFPQWRKKLDDSWTQCQFQLDNHSWASVEHYILGGKFRKNPEFRWKFALDNPTPLCKNVSLARQAALPQQQTKDNNNVIRLRPSNVHVDSDYTAEQEMKDRVFAVNAKFSQNADLRTLLLATYPAKLKHFLPKRGAVDDAVLMAVRQSLREHVVL